MKFNSPNYLLFLFCILLISGCKKKNENKALESSNLWEYREYIAGVTKGEISRESEVQINLMKAIEGYEDGEQLPSNVFTIEPHVAGKLRLVDQNTIAFLPNKPLKSDQIYTVKFHLKKLFHDEKLKKPLSFQFRTIRPDFSVLINALQNSETIEDEQELQGHIETADIMDLSDVKKLIQARQHNRKLDIEFEDAERGKYFNYTIKGIKPEEQKTEIVVTWNGRPVDINTKGAETIELPGTSDFSIIRFAVQNDPEQILELNFSGEIDKNQNLDGLIQLDGKDKGFDYRVERNLLKIYPEKTLSGEVDVIVSEGVKNITGVKSSQYSNTVTFKGAKPEIRLLSSGSILPNSQGLKLNFETVSLRAVDVRVTKIYEKNALQFLQVNSLAGENQIKRVGRPVVWKRVLLNQENNTGWKASSLDLANLIQADPGAIYHVELSFKKNYSTYDCGSEEEPEALQEQTIFYSGRDSFWDNDAYYDPYWDFESYNWRERDNPCHEAYFNQNKKISTNVLASNLGLIAKKGENGHIMAITTDLVAAEPEAGVLVKFYNYQMKKLLETTSSSDGFALYQGNEDVAFVEASFKGEKSYLKLTDGDALSMSQFKTEGYTSKKGLKGMIYTERGIWRPGDEIFFTFILNDIDRPLPNEHPVKFELKDPEGVVIDEQVSTEGIDGFYSFASKTKESDKTGNYRAKVTVGNVAFYKNLPIEKIKPNRLKINFEVEENNYADLEAKWLHGATAADLKATVTANLRSQKTTFKGYQNFSFDDPASDFDADEISVFDGRLNAQGKVNFKIDFEEDLAAPGKLRATYITKVYEKGGSFSIDALSQDYSPYSSYVGISAPETKNYYQQFDTDETYEFQVATVDEEGRPMAVRNLEVEVYKVNFRWWWNRSSENLASYVTGSASEPVFETKISTDNKGRGKFKFGIDYPEWGRYLVRVKNPESGHATGQTIYFDWPSWRGRSQREGAEAPNILDFSTDKEKYKMGEKVKINFPSTAGGRALVSIESGSKVLDAFWVAPKDGFTNVEFKTTAEMAPNVYINITYLQQHANTANDLPIRLYGVIPIEVYDDRTKLEPKIKMQDEIEPEEVYTVKVSEARGKPMTYTLAVVDEGLLDLTRFKTPNAWDQFFKKQALGVKSWDVYDDVIGAYSGRIDQIYSLGGGDAAEAAGAKKAQRFKPVVTYLGPFNLNANKTESHEIKMPYYVGSVRVMVVAGNTKNNAYGSTDKAVPVKKPLMILGTLPRKISQNELIDLPVSVFAMDKKVKNVSLSVKTNDLIEIVEGNTSQLQFSSIGEKEASFQLRTTGITGIGTVEITAEGGGETAKYEVEIDVTNPNERESKFSDFELGPNQTLTIPVEAISTNGTDEASLQLSTIPNLDFTKRIEELIRYPHGCAEQVTSSVFPQLFLPDVANTTDGQEAEIIRNVQDAIYRLKNYQASDGGFQYWPGSNYINDYVTSYVGHFLLEAKDKGYKIPLNMLPNWKQYQTKISNKNYRSTSNYNQFRQAYRLYTLALAGSANLSAMNRLRETKNLNKETRWRLAAAYAVAGQQKTARKLINAIQDDFNDFDEIYRYGSSLRNQAMALETALLLDDKDLSKSFAEDIAERLSRNRWYSTQTTAYSLYSLSQFVESQGGSGFSVQLEGDGENQRIETEKAIAITTLSPPEGSKMLQLQNKKENTVYVRLVQSGIPPVGQETAVSNGLTVDLKYFDTEGNKLTVNTLSQATEFVAKITVKNLTMEYVNHVAMTQILPSGWEIINTRYTELGNEQPSIANYIDIRDDRVNYYFDLGREESKTFQLQLNASFTGEYYLPGAIAEAMYAKDDFYVKQKGFWVEVVE